jgi:hypothetical protein
LLSCLPSERLVVSFGAKPQDGSALSKALGFVLLKVDIGQALKLLPRLDFVAHSRNRLGGGGENHGHSAGEEMCWQLNMNGVVLKAGSCCGETRVGTTQLFACVI